jgi:hypothetical protein
MLYVINIPNTFTLTPLMIPSCTGHHHQAESERNIVERESKWQLQHNRTMFPLRFSACCQRRCLAAIQGVLILTQCCLIVQ